GGDTTGFVPLDSAEIYDPSTSQFTAAGPMTVARDYAVAGLLTSGPLAGEVIVAGGNLDGGGTRSADLYCPATGLFTATGDLSVARVLSAGAMLGNGKFLVAGGDTTGAATGDVYDPAKGTFMQVGPVPGGNHRLGAAVVLADGRVAVI